MPDTTADTSRATTDRPPLRVGLVGYGVAGRTFHTPHINAAEDVTLTHVVTSSEDRAAQAREDTPGVEVVPDLAALLARADDLDLVVVASPGPLHAEHARAVLETGTACLVDKPFVVDPADGHALIDLAAARGVPLAVFQNRRYDDEFLLAADTVRSGRLGEVYRFESRLERWQPTQAKAWKAQATVAEGGGLLYDLGAHLIDQAVQLFGAPVASEARIDRRSQATVADDDTTVDLTHPGGVRSHLVMSTVTAIPGPRMSVVGERGALVIPTPDRQEACLKSGVRPGAEGYAARPEGELPRLVLGDEPQPTPSMTYAGYVDFYRDLARYVRGEGPNPAEPAASLAVVELIRDLHDRFPLR